MVERVAVANVLEHKIKSFFCVVFSMCIYSTGLSWRHTTESFHLLSFQINPVLNNSNIYQTTFTVVTPVPWPKHRRTLNKSTGPYLIFCWTIKSGILRPQLIKIHNMHIPDIQSKLKQKKKCCCCRCTWPIERTRLKQTNDLIKRIIKMNGNINIQVQDTRRVKINII